MNSKIIAIVNQKGGVGKTTTAVNLSVALSQLGKKVLAIDIDPQAHLTYSLGVQAHQLEKTIYEVLKRQIPVADVLIERNGVTLLPSSLDLAAADVELAGVPGREFLLQEAVGELPKEYEYILIDCPPNLGILTLNALTTAQEVYIPVQCEFLALKGMSKLTQTVDLVKERLNKKLKITGVIGTRFHKGKSLHKEVESNLKEHFGDKVFNTLIRENISLAEAPSYGQSIFEYAPDSHGAEDYLKLSKEILGG
jgi:chromosome partitioning protein